MCGGLVTASCNGGKDILKYQFGRFLGYSLMGSLMWSAGHFVKSVFSLEYASLVTGLLLGCLFIFWGIQSFQGRRAEVPLPAFLGRAYRYLFRNFAAKAGTYRSLVVGLISIMLPCGLVYGLIIAAIALGTYEQVLISLLFFWLGTLPAMVGAPQLVKKILQPMKARLPKVYAVLFIVIGVSTIAGRFQNFNLVKAEPASTKTVRHCH